MKQGKRLSFTLLAVIVIVLILATIIEKLYGSEFVATHLYHSPLFILLWGVFVVSSLLYIIKQQVFKKKAVFLIHIAFVVILIGALTTYLHGKQGLVHLREKESIATFTCKESNQEISLPFNISLEEFKVIYYVGTPSPMDFVSRINIVEQGTKVKEGEISMNKILAYKGYRFYQSGYDEDEQGTILSVSYDPFGIAITYCGYGLLLLSLILFFFVHNTKFRFLIKKLSNSKSAVLFFFVLLSTNLFAADKNEMPRVLPKEVASAFGDLYVLHNERICPLQTLAKEFTTKLYGKPEYRGLTAEQVFTGWLFFYSSWQAEPMIKIKSQGVRSLLEVDSKYVSLNDFINKANEYKLDHVLNELRRNTHSTTHKEIKEADEKYNIIRFMYSGKMLKLFPYHESETNVIWYAQGDDLPSNMDDKQWLLIKKTQDYIHEMVVKKTIKV